MILLIIFSVVSEVMKMQSVHHLLEPILEPLIRKVVSSFSLDEFICDNRFYIYIELKGYLLQILIFSVYANSLKHNTIIY